MEQVQRSGKLYNRALFLEYVTIAWNIFEGLASVFVGLLSGSIVLFAYGLESSIEVFASAVVVWELKGMEKEREKIALKLIGAAYLVVSLYIFIDVIKSFIDGKHPERSFLGIMLMIVTACVMTTLGLLKKKVGKQLGSSTVLADAKFTLIDAALSSTVLVGLLFNVLFGFWWMDQAMALFLSGVAFREGLREVL
jgi:divalent metal cation (Fe/Co/Zn/Cd) transporter